MNWDTLRNHAWWLAAALIVSANLVVLAGAAYNRSEEQQGRFEFSQRELSPPWRWHANREDSGLAVHLTWRMPELFGDSEHRTASRASWLDEEKMQALGFPPRPATSDRPRRPRPLPRDVWLVLEFDGDEYHGVLTRARHTYDQALLAMAAEPDDTKLAERARGAEQQWLRERDESSRLFVIDAGLDPDRLRQQYPQRSRYLIAGGRIRPSWSYYSGAELQYRVAAGHVDSLNVSTIHVPARFRSTLLPLLETTARTSDPHRYTISVVYGRRHEPWVVDVRPAP